MREFYRDLNEDIMSVAKLARAFRIHENGEDGDEPGVLWQRDIAVRISMENINK